MEIIGDAHAQEAVAEARVLGQRLSQRRNLQLLLHARGYLVLLPLHGARALGIILLHKLLEPDHRLANLLLLLRQVLLLLLALSNARGCAR